MNQPSAAAKVKTECFVSKPTSSTKVVINDSYCAGGRILTSSFIPEPQRVLFVQIHPLIQRRICIRGHGAEYPASDSFAWNIPESIPAQFLSEASLLPHVSTGFQIRGLLPEGQELESTQRR